jgi:hypothetical protein
MRLVERVDIREFRGIRRLERPLELGRFNVVVGRNCVGKTAILQALFLLAMPDPSYSIQPYGKSASSYLADLAGGWNRLVYGYSGEASVEFEIGVEWLLEGIIPARRLKVSLQEGRVVVAAEGRVLGGAMLSELAKLVNPHGSVLALYIPNNSLAYSMLHEYAYRSLDGIVKMGLHTRVFRELLRDVVYDRFTEVFPRESELYARKEVGDTAIYVRLSDLGEGVRRFILTYFAVEHLNPVLVLWDDIEVAAHPSLLDTLVRWLARSGRQVVVATHSADVLESVVRAEPEDAQVILLRKDSSDVVYHRSLSLGEVEELLDKGIDPRSLAEGLVP